MLGVLSSIAAVGAYSRAWTLGRRFIEITYRITEMLYPTLVERHARGDVQGFDRALVDSIRYSTVGLLLPAAAGGGAAAGIMAIFGPGFSRGADALMLLLLMPAMFTVTCIQRHVLYTVDRPLLTTYGASGRMILTLASGVVLTLRFGETGMAVAILLGLLADLAYMSRVAPSTSLAAVSRAVALPADARRAGGVRLRLRGGPFHLRLASRCRRTGRRPERGLGRVCGRIRACRGDQLPRSRTHRVDDVARVRAGRSPWPTPRTQP